jgi:hypothetical protein
MAGHGVSILRIIHNSNNETNMGSGYSISSSAESKERAGKILPTNGKEDVSF